MSVDLGDPLERMTPAELIGLVRTLIGEVTRFQAEYEKVSGALAKLRVEHQAVKDELARLKKLPPRPPQKPSGMDKATDRPDSQANAPKGGRSTQRRGSNLDKLTVTQTIEVKVDAPAGSRHTPTPRKTTSASSSPSAKSPAGPSATEAATPATSCSGSPRPAGSSKSPSSTISALASPFQAPKSPISQLSSGPPQAN